MDPTFADFSNGMIRTANADVALHNCCVDPSHLELLAGASVTLDFTVQRPAEIQQATLTLTALVSKVGPSPGHAPLDVLLGGVSLAEAVTVPGGGELRTDMSFAVPGGLLVEGRNRLVVRTAATSDTALWLYHITLDPVQRRGQSERALAAAAAHKSVLAFETLRRELGESLWTGGRDLLFLVDRDENAPLEHLSWRTPDGAEAAVCFQANLSEFTGWLREADGTLAELRGHEYSRWGRVPGEVASRVRKFRTEEQWAGSWHSSPDVLRLLVEDGDVPAERISWRDQRGNTGSIHLTAGLRSSSGTTSGGARGPSGTGAPRPTHSRRRTFPPATARERPP
ncbi:hypothetical protein ACFZAV_42910 [Streptomyces sp. NPDC008343]|uniref:hypothetical protein n=1 Tax=Streptomyces sp. NPDC008343 TaxID=3364828 RepID=UPI0036EE13C2